MPKKLPIFYSALLLTGVNLLLRLVGTSFQVYISGRIGAAGVGLLQRDIIMLTSPPQTGMVQWSAMCLHILQTQLLSILLHLSSTISAR